MTTEYSSPYKVGLIYVGTKFAQSRLLWSEVAYGKLNFRGTVANANLAPHQSVQAIIQGGTRYVDFFWFLSRLDFRFGPFHFFPVFDSTCDLLPDSALKNVKAWYRLCFDSKPPNIPAYRPGTLVCFIRGVKVHGHMSHSSVWRTRTQNSYRSAPHILFNFCKRLTQFNKNTSPNALSV